MRTALIVIAQTGFQDVELKGTRDGLTQGGFEVILASTEAGECTGKFNSTEIAALALRDVNVADYDTVAFIGGPGAGALADDTDAKRIAVETVRLGKILGAICIAPTILAKAGVLKGKKATVWDKDGDQKELLRSCGAEVQDAHVVVDGILITADGPEAAAEFGKKLAAL